MVSLGLLVPEMNSQSSRLTLYVALVLALTSAPAYAYLDPGTGSALIQGLIAVVAGVGVTLKLYWHRIKGFFSRRSEKKPLQGSKSDGR